MVSGKETEKKQKEVVDSLAVSVKQTLIQQTNIHEALFSQLPVGVIYQKNNGVISLANPAAEKILGCNLDALSKVTKDSLPWKTYSTKGELMSLEAHPGMLALATGQPQRDVIMQLVMEEGQSIWIKVNSEIVYDAESGKQTGAITSFADISDERNANVALQALTDRSQVAIESAGMGVWDWLPDQSLMIWDSRLYQMHGFPDEEVSVKDAWDRSVHPEDRERADTVIHGLAKSSGNHKLEYRVVWPDKSIHHIRAQARIVKDEDDTVIRIIGVAQDVTKDILAEKKLWELAYTDALTGAYSRAGLAFRMSRSVVRANKSKGSFCVMMVGLSRFKEINDNYGIAIGDKVLAEIAKRIKGLLKEDDSLVRAGGDEFIVVMEDTSEQVQVETFSKNFREQVLSPLFLEQGIVVNVEAAVGVSFYPKNGRDAITLQTRAGLAMHQAKADKSENFIFYSAQMSDSIRRKYNLKYQLRNAIHAEELQLFYQPIVDLHNNNKVVGCEALIRWKDSEGNFVSPMEFIPIAEESGMIYELGQWINLTAIKQWKLWQALVPELQYISINVSPHQLEKPEFVEDLMALMDEHKVKPENIQLEITEGTFLKESLMADSTLTNLADIGFRLAIDDFGTGYSSLAYLKRFNVDVIKIDRSFIIDIETDQSDKDIVSAILAMNTKLGFKTLVEGVETEKQSQIVRELGCDSGQGYLYGKPTFADEFAEKYIWNSAGSKKAV